MLQFRRLRSIFTVAITTDAEARKKLIEKRNLQLPVN